jgi:hypothetical protein
MGATSFRPAWVLGAVRGVGQHGRGLAVPPDMGATSFRPAWDLGAGLANMAVAWRATSHGCHVIPPCLGFGCGVGQHGLGLACHLTWVPRHSALL